MYIRFFKRLCDFCISLICSIIFLPIFIILIIVVKLDSKGPVFFRQERVGKDKKLFHILKFRTMKVDTPKEIPTCMLENPEQYITRVGKFLRKTSLDELPQIWNILAGQMSLIIVAVLKREGMVEGTAGQSKNKEETHQTDER